MGPLGKSRRRWDEDITRHFRKIGWECVDWIMRLKGQVVEFCEHGNERGIINLETSGSKS
jgi:hypothetical protein